MTDTYEADLECDIYEDTPALNSNSNSEESAYATEIDTDDIYELVDTVPAGPHRQFRSGSHSSIEDEAPSVEEILPYNRHDSYLSVNPVNTPPRSRSPSVPTAPPALPTRERRFLLFRQGWLEFGGDFDSEKCRLSGTCVTGSSNLGESLKNSQLSNVNKKLVTKICRKELGWSKKWSGLQQFMMQITTEHGKVLYLIGRDEPYLQSHGYWLSQLTKPMKVSDQKARERSASQSAMSTLASTSSDRISESEFYFDPTDRLSTSNSLGLPRLVPLSEAAEEGEDSPVSSVDTSDQAVDERLGHLTDTDVFNSEDVDNHERYYGVPPPPGDPILLRLSNKNKISRTSGDIESPEHSTHSSSSSSQSTDDVSCQMVLPAADGVSSQLRIPATDDVSCQIVIHATEDVVSNSRLCGDSCSENSGEDSEPVSRVGAKLKELRRLATSSQTSASSHWNDNVAPLVGAIKDRISLFNQAVPPSPPTQKPPAKIVKDFPLQRDSTAEKDENGLPTASPPPKVPVLKRLSEIRRNGGIWWFSEEKALAGELSASNLKSHLSRKSLSTASSHSTQAIYADPTEAVAVEPVLEAFSEINPDNVNDNTLGSEPSNLFKTSLVTETENPLDLGPPPPVNQLTFPSSQVTQFTARLSLDPVQPTPPDYGSEVVASAPTVVMNNCKTSEEDGIIFDTPKIDLNGEYDIHQYSDEPIKDAVSDICGTDVTLQNSSYAQGNILNDANVSSESSPASIRRKWPSSSALLQFAKTDGVIKPPVATKPKLQVIHHAAAAGYRATPADVCDVGVGAEGRRDSLEGLGVRRRSSQQLATQMRLSRTSLGDIEPDPVE